MTGHRLLMFLAAAALLGGCASDRPTARELVDPPALLEDLSVRIAEQPADHPRVALVAFTARTYHNPADLPDDPVAVNVPNFVPLFDELAYQADGRTLLAGSFVAGPGQPRWDVLSGEVLGMSAPLPVEVRLPAADGLIRLEALSFEELQQRTGAPEVPAFTGVRLFISAPDTTPELLHQWPWFVVAGSGETDTASYLGARLVLPGR